MIEWREKPEIDGDVIDDDHRHLVGLINQFETAKGVYRDLLVIVQSVKHYVRTHFEREEELQRKIGFAEAETHHVQHQQLIDRLEDMIAEFISVEHGDYRAVRLKLAMILRDWLVEHIVGEDLKTKPLLHKMRPHSARLRPLGSLK